MVTLGPSAKIKFFMVSEPTISGSLEVYSTFCASVTVESLSFASLIYAWKKQISSEKANKIHYMGDLHLQLPSTDLYLECGTGTKKTFWTGGDLPVIRGDSFVFLFLIFCKEVECIELKSTNNKDAHIAQIYLFGYDTLLHETVTDQCISVCNYM